MTANTPTVQLLTDQGQTAILKVTGYYTAANDSDTIILAANTLAWANANADSNVCTLSISKIQYASDMAEGFVQLYWVGANSNAEIVTFGTSQAGKFDAFIPNNAGVPQGQIGLAVSGSAANDSFNFIVTINKEKGFDRAFVAYNDNTFKPA